MERTDALRVLGVFEEDDPEEIRKRYRDLIRKHHPDTAGNVPEHLDRAQQLTQAYKILKKEGYLKDLQNQRGWGIRVNRDAFTKRSVLMQEELSGNEMIVDTGIYGKYCWDPEIEPFSLFMKSVGAAVNRILRSYPDCDYEEAWLLRMRAMLFHLLVQQFVDPFAAIRAVEYIRQTDKNTYRISCHIQNERGVSSLHADGRSLAVGISGNNLVVESGKQNAVLSFTENELYYIITPMFLQGAASGEFRLREETASGKRKKYLTGELILTVDEKKGRDRTEEINKEIRRILFELQEKQSQHP
ncbi:MAG: J domain-containing protein [Lachnospiraceae bacterium]|nr:J domain-containing protein [Lachnospiraceae bacterium]